jgi:hypothetical protein
MVPTTFNGISSGMATSTSAAEAAQPFLGISNAMPMPRISHHGRPELLLSSAL